MKKVKMILTGILLSLIIVLSGCSGGKLSTLPWTKNEIEQMKNDDVPEQGKQDGSPKKVSPFVRYTF